MAPADLSRRPALVRAALLLLSAAVAWHASFSPLSFVGAPSSQGRASSPVQTHGWRFDQMLERKEGNFDLITAEGYWIGEKGFEKIMNTKGMRYRMRPTKKEFEENVDVDGLLWQFGPVKMRLGEAFGGSSNNPAKRDLKRYLVKTGLTDPVKLEENKYWLQRYGHKRWRPKNVEQSQGLPGGPFRGLAAWSGYDPLKEERGVTWFEADWGKLGPVEKEANRLPGWVTKEQVEKEFASGRLLNK